MRSLQTRLFLSVLGVMIALPTESIAVEKPQMPPKASPVIDYGPDPFAKLVIHVGVDVDADEELRARVQSLLLRELRSIPDLDVVSGLPPEDGFLIAVIAIATKTEGSQQSNGYAISVVSGTRMSRAAVTAAAVVGADGRNDLADALRTMAPRAFTDLNHQLLIGNSTNLEQTIKTFVAELDTKNFEAIRSARRTTSMPSN